LFRLEVADPLSALIAELHPQIKRKLRAAIELVLADPLSGKALRAQLRGHFSFRVGRHRLIYRIARGRRVQLIAFGPRERIYEETLRLLGST
jgi:mRNA interferase RelE/StbE